jgi:hypothetical protein
MRGKREGASQLTSKKAKEGKGQVDLQEGKGGRVGSERINSQGMVISPLPPYYLS